MNYPKNITIDGISFKSYLTLDEVTAIGDMVLTETNWLKRQATLIGGVIGYCVDEQDREGLDLDAMYCNGLLDTLEKKIKNFNQIDEYIKYSENPSQLIMPLFNSISGALNRVTELLSDENIKVITSKVNETIEKYDTKH